MWAKENLSFYFFTLQLVSLDSAFPSPEQENFGEPVREAFQLRTAESGPRPLIGIELELDVVNLMCVFSNSLDLGLEGIHVSVECARKAVSHSD